MNEIGKKGINKRRVVLEINKLRRDDFKTTQRFLFIRTRAFHQSYLMLFEKLAKHISDT